MDVTANVGMRREKREIHGPRQLQARAAEKASPEAGSWVPGAVEASEAGLPSGRQTLLSLRREVLALQFESLCGAAS